MADEVARTKDDYVLPFQIESSGARGRLVRMGPAISAILSQHDYPPAVSNLLGEAMTLTAMLGAALKIDGKFILQTRSEGPVSFLVAHYYAPGNIRGYASFDQSAFEGVGETRLAEGAKLLGDGHLAMTIDQGPEMARYQGIVALEGESLEAAADQYFRQSEQIPTRVRLAVGQSYVPGRGLAWRAGGMMIQFLPTSPERQRMADLPPGDAPEGAQIMEQQEDDAWVEARLLLGTVEDHELIDPMVPAEELLYRLFHERGVRVFESSPVVEKCRCSREAVTGMLRNFSKSDRRDMVADDGSIVVTCEFCNTRYDFDQAQTQALIEEET